MGLEVRNNLLIEVAFAEDREVACRVVGRRDVARNLGPPQFANVAIAVNADVIRDVDPSQLVLVVPLVLAEAAWGVTVVAQYHALVVDRHTGEGM